MQMLAVIGLINFPYMLAQYLDPGTGSYAIQLIIAGVMALLFWLKPIKLKIKSLFTKIPANKSENGK
jgi:hypothetical protein